MVACGRMESAQSVGLIGPAGVKRAVSFGPNGRELHGFFHEPAAGRARDVGVVLCNPLGTDLTRSDRAYRHLAERLAAAGFPVLRYDMLATGDSAGDEREPGLVRAWLDDIGRAGDELKALSGVTKIVLCGLRLGATLAMAHAAERSGSVDGLVLWSPCVSGKAFVSEAVKLHKLYLRIEPQLAGALPLQEDGEEALGVFLARTTVDDLGKIDLLAIEKSPATRTLVIDGGGVAGRDALLARLGELGSAPELRVHPGHRFLITISHRAALPEDILEAIVAWMDRSYPPVAAVGGGQPAVPRASTTPFGEIPIVFGDRPLYGILTPAHPERASPDRPPIVLTNAGCVNRSGPHRQYVRMARRWAALGFDVLRVDLSGIGDSPAAPGTVENVTYPPSGLDDLDQAMKFFERRSGAKRFIVAGLCSGGDYAFQLGSLDARVATAVIMNPRTFCMLDLQAVESASAEPPGPTVNSVPSTLGAMASGGVDTLLIVSVKDPGIAYVDTHFPDDIKRVADLPAFRRIDVVGTDHTFTPVFSQVKVEELVTRHLAARYLPDGGAPP